MTGEIARTTPQFVIVATANRRMVHVPWRDCRFGMNDVGHGTKVVFDVVQVGNTQQIRNVKLAG